MEDINSASVQLTKLKTLLALKESELQTHIEHFLSERSVLDSFIRSLLDNFHGLDNTLDHHLAKIGPQIEKHADVSLFEDDLKSIQSFLFQHKKQKTAINQENVETIRSHATEIVRNALLPENISEKARDFIKDFTAQNESDYYKYIVRILELYQESLRTMLLRVRETSDVRSNLAEHTEEYVDANKIRRLSGDDIAFSLSNLNPTLFSQINDELQRLITELDFHGPAGEKLASIRQRLLKGIEPADLPALCLELITLIIEGARYERAQSYAFIHLIGEQLQTTQEDLSDVVTRIKDINQDDIKKDRHIIQQVQIIREAFNNQLSLNELQDLVPRHLSTIDHLLKERTQQEMVQQNLIRQIEALNEKLKATEDEATSYRNKLNRQQQRLQVDTLTQLHNRSALDERLALEYKRWLRYQSPLCLAIVDVDHFKLINDQFGHLAGDKALKVIARALSTALRDTDFVARFGGEEFVVLLPGINENNISLPLEKLRNVVKNIPFRFKDEKLSISISIGASLFQQGDRITDVFERADRALYAAKNSGRDCIHIIR